jgi:hypothetical protein
MTTQRKPIYTNSPLDSSFIIKVSWYEDAEVLMVTFNTGSIWIYNEVPFEIYSALVKAHSHGKFFNSNIRNMYSGQRIGYFIPDLLEV